MTPHRWHAPDSVTAALAAWRSAGDPRWLAGGQTLLQAMKLGLSAPSDLVSLQRIPGLDAIIVRDGVLRIGAMATHASVARSDLVRRLVPALSELADGIGDPAVRSRGTLGGSIANADPAACYPSALLALDATVLTDRRSIPAQTFFVDLFATALDAGELVIAVDFRIPQNAAYVKFRHPASRFAVVGVFVARFADDIRVAVTGARSSAFRVAAFESALRGHFDVDALTDASLDTRDFASDAFAGADYRAALLRYGAQRAVARMAGAVQPPHA